MRVGRCGPLEAAGIPLTDHDHEWEGLLGLSPGVQPTQYTDGRRSRSGPIRDQNLQPDAERVSAYDDLSVGMKVRGQIGVQADGEPALAAQLCEGG